MSKRPFAKTLFTNLGMFLLVFAAALTTGCSVSDLGLSGTSSSSTIDVSGSPGTTSSTQTAIPTPVPTPTPTPVSSTETASTLPAPAASTAAPQSPATSVNVPTSIDTQEAISELKNTYNISVSGSYVDASIRNVLISARQLYPADTKKLSITFTDQNAGGVMGMWSSAGKITIYAPAKKSLTTVFHEICHHATLYSTSTHGAQVAQEVVDVIGRGDNPKNFPASVITRSYAQTMIEEFWAEIFSVYRIKLLGLDGSAPGFTGTFNPPEKVRTALNKMYVTSGS